MTRVSLRRFPNHQQCSTGASVTSLYLACPCRIQLRVRWSLAVLHLPSFGRWPVVGDAPQSVLRLRARVKFLALKRQRRSPRTTAGRRSCYTASMHRHHFHSPTPLDVIAALAVVVAVCVLIIALANPEVKLARAHDAQRTEDVREITQAVLELKENNPERFSDLQSDLVSRESAKVMLGTGQDCSGAYGLCGNEELDDVCFDLASYAADLLPVVPHDPANVFTPAKTGYYLTFSDDSFEVGACAPERQEEIRLKSAF